MPTFGEFETVGEPIAVTDYRGHVTTVWRARKLGTQDDPGFAVKCFAPHRRKAAASQEEEALDRDHGLEFLEGVKQLKKAHAEGGRSLCPIHAFGLADEGASAWYVTDFYPRNTLKAWIARRGSVDGGALAQVVRCVCAAGLALKRSRGYSHGNLKAANIFLVGKPRPLRQTPLELGDVYPSGAAPLTRLESAENRDAKALLGDVMEVQDLRALGELILQLVEGRLISSAFDYNYPIAPSPAWERLGRDADRWRELCNRLLDPQLSLTKLSFESLAREFRPSAVAGKLPLIAGAIGVIVLIAGGAIYFATRPRLPTTAAPVTTPAGGRFTESVAVTLTTPMAEATIYYTLDGSEPTTNSTVYSQALVLTETKTVSARAFARDHKPSKAVKADFVVTAAPVVAPPTIAPPPAVYPDLVTVTLASATPGATIYYTTNNTDPTTNAMRYVGPITLTSSVLVKARAFASGHKDSLVVSGNFGVTITPVAARPTIRPDGGNHRDSVSVELSTTTPGATIYYTTDGREPTPQSLRYTRAFPLTTNATVKAKAAASGHKDSPTVTATFNVSPVPVVVAPVISPAGGAHKDSVTVSLTSITTGAIIRYTTNNADPTASATRYTGPFTLTNSVTVKARAFAADQNDSAITSAEFVVTATPVAAQPVIKPDGGTHRDSVTVELSTTTPGATIYYTTDGREPTPQSLRYTRAFTLTNTTTIKARAVANNFKDSPTASATFNVSTPQFAGAPAISPAGGEFRDEVMVSLTSPTPGAAIYYTTNGSEPTPSATRYTAAFKLTGTNVVSARAFAPNYEPSPTSRAEFKVAPTPIAAAPVIGPAQRSHVDSVTVTMESATAGAAIYYTLDGREPTTGSARYQQPITLTETKTVKARAVARDHRDSPVASAEFTVRTTPVTIAPTFSPNGGTQADLVVVQLQSITPRAGIYLTLDGSDPTTNSARYEQPLMLSQPTTIKALAWAEGHKPSVVVSATFTVTNTPLIAMAPARAEVVAGQSVPVKLGGSGPKGATLNYELQTRPGKGQVSDPSGGNVTYTAAETAGGEDSFTFVVSDGRRQSAPAKVLLTIISKFDQRVAAARQALLQTNLVAADKIITEVQALNQGSPLVAELRGAWQVKLKEVTDAIAGHRQRAEYPKAQLLCERHKGLREVDDAARTLVDEIREWNYANTAFGEGVNYEFIDTLRNNSSYATRSPFRELLGRATTERSNYVVLAELAQTPANWKQVLDGLNKLPPETVGKKLFQDLYNWSKNLELGERDKLKKELDDADQKLADWAYFLKGRVPRWFNGKPRAGITPHSGDLPQTTKQQINVQIDSIEKTYERVAATLDATGRDSRAVTVRELRDDLLFRN